MNDNYINIKNKLSAEHKQNQEIVDKEKKKLKALAESFYPTVSHLNSVLKTIASPLISIAPKLETSLILNESFIKQFKANQALAFSQIASAQINAESLLATAKLFDSSLIVGMAITSNKALVGSLKGMAISLPKAEAFTTDIVGHPGTEVIFSKPIERKNNEIEVQADISQSLSVHTVEFSVMTKMELRLVRIEEKVDIMSETNMRQEKHIEELLDIIKDKGQSLFKIKKATLIRDTNELNINDNYIPLSENSKELEICKIIFKSKRTLQKKWDYDELHETLGTSTFTSKGFYDVFRHLNDKIAAKAKLPEFFIYTTRTASINPKYI